VDTDEELDASPLMLQGEVAALAERYASSVSPLECSLPHAHGALVTSYLAMGHDVDASLALFLWKLPHECCGCSHIL
jgi:hypothetical protein